MGVAPYASNARMGLGGGGAPIFVISVLQF